MSDRCVYPNLVISGSSDDLVVVRHGAVVDELNVYDLPCRLRLVDDDGAGCLVAMDYGKGSGDEGTWGAWIDLLDEGVPIPWTIEVSHVQRPSGPSYSVEVIVHGFDGRIA